MFVVGLLTQQRVLGSTVARLLGEQLGAVLGQGLQEAEQWAPTRHCIEMLGQYSREGSVAGVATLSADPLPRVYHSYLVIH